jgi:CheY-like chemotaxis protein
MALSHIGIGVNTCQTPTRARCPRLHQHRKCSPMPEVPHFLASPHLTETACLIADVHMPAMTGIELYKRLIDAGHWIPTILVTAYPNDVDRPAPCMTGSSVTFVSQCLSQKIEFCKRLAVRVSRHDEPRRRLFDRATARKAAFVPQFPVDMQLIALNNLPNFLRIHSPGLAEKSIV